MIFSYLQKHLLILIRNPQELLILLCMPLILIAILGYSLGGIMNGDAEAINAKVAFIDYGNEEEEKEAFFHDLENSDIPQEAIIAMKEGADKISPVSMLKDIVLGNDEIKEYIHVETVQPSKIAEARNSDEYAVVIEVPENFTYDVLSSIFLKKETSAHLSILKNEGQIFNSQMAEDIIVSFQKQYSTMSIAGQYGILINSQSYNQEPAGTIETVTKHEPISSVEYYTVGMSAMFILFVASFISSSAFNEKKIQVFNRILLSNTSRWTYFTAIFTTAALLTFLQQLILYGVTALVFQIRFDDLFAFLTVCAALSFAVGGLASLLTAISYRAESETVLNFFSSILVSIMAFLGGSFFQTSDLSPAIQSIGSVTPNGAGMKAILKLLQGYGIEDIINYLVILILFGIITTVIAISSFPKRGKAV